MMGINAKEDFTVWQAELSRDPGYLNWLDILDAKPIQEKKMSLISKDAGSGDFKLVPEGTHLARCYLLTDVGYQETKFGTKLQVVIGWEIPGQLLDSGLPMIIYSTYTNSMNEKANLRLHLESWRGRKMTEKDVAGFDLRNILGHPCLLTVLHNSEGPRTYANVTAVTPVPDGLPVPEAVNDKVMFDIDEDADAKHLPEWIQKKIAEAKTGTETPETDESSFADLEDIPF